MRIKESVDSLYRDGANMTRPLTKMKHLSTPERYSYKDKMTYEKMPQPPF